MSRDSVTNVHLDTSFVRPLILQRKNENQYRHCKSVITKAQGSYKTVVSQVVIGELITTLIRDVKDNEKAIVITSTLTTELDSLAGKNLDGLLPVSRDVLEISQEVMKRDPLLDPTDVLIVSQALQTQSHTHYSHWTKRLLNQKV